MNDPSSLLRKMKSTSNDPLSQFIIEALIFDYFEIYMKSEQPNVV